MFLELGFSTLLFSNAKRVATGTVESSDNLFGVIWFFSHSSSILLIIACVKDILWPPLSICNYIKKIIKNKEKLNIKEKVKSTTMLMLAVTLHNIPEGMAVGVAFAGLFSQNTGITLAEAFALAIGIAIQNIPEGAIISMPLHSSGKSKFKSFLGGTLSGIVEPIGAIITIALTRIVVPILPYFLSFAAGAMIYVVSSELIPEAQAEKKSNLVTVSVGVGFVIMMLLDVALG